MSVLSRVLPGAARADPARELERRERLALEETMRKEAQYYQGVIVSTLSRLGLVYVSSSKRQVEQVQIARSVSTPEAHYFRVDLQRLPYKVKVTDLQSDDAMGNLKGAVGRMVHAQYDDPGRGFWYIVERAAGVRGIPSKFSYKDAFEQIPQKAAELVFCVGVGRNSKVILTNLAAAPHLLVAGSTGMGKSVFVNSIIVTLARRNPPDRLQFYLVDLKGGVELADYEHLPHLARPVITEQADVLDILDELLTTVEERMEMFKGHARNIQGWNKGRRKNRLPYIVLVIDELAMLMLNRERIDRQSIGSLAENKLAKLAAISRAAGVHIVAATQRPSVDVITGLIKANFSVRCAFACADDAQSRTILDNAMAAELTMPGRMIFHKANEYIELHAPLVTEEMAEEIANALARHAPVTETHNVSHAEVMRYALAHFCRKDETGEPLEVDGEIRYYLPGEHLYKAFASRGVTQLEIREILAQLEEERIVTLDDHQYEIRPAAGSAPRYFVRCSLSVANFAGGDTPLSTPEEGSDAEHACVPALEPAFERPVGSASPDGLEQDQNIDDPELRPDDLPF
jgi:DNA segregation ATPase FtsK/SpoIIIE-like protein